MENAAGEAKTAAVSRADILRMARDCAREIGEASRASRVLLFGSAARGERAARDFDFLAIVADDVPGGPGAAWDRANDAVSKSRERHRGWPPVDIIVQTESFVEKWRDCPYIVTKPALDEGVEVWRAG